MPQAPLQDASFTLDTSGIAGFFGGPEAVAAMSTVHIFSGRRWLGWYNSPGSYEIAKRYGRLAKARLWRGLYPGDGSDPVKLFGLSGKTGPRFIAAESGTDLAVTGHLAYLLAKRCKSMNAQVIPGRPRASGKFNVSVVHLKRIPSARGHVYSKWDYFTTFIALITVSANIAMCAACAVYEEWYSFAMILLGIVANGISSFVIGSGTLELCHAQTAAGSPRGDGVMINGSDMILLLGDEGAVNFVTRGSFQLDLSSWSIMHSKDDDHLEEKLIRPTTLGSYIPFRHTTSSPSKGHHVEPTLSIPHPAPKTPPKSSDLNSVGACSLLLTIQFIAQLLLIPQSSLFGQIMFLSTLGVSWIYNSYLASLDRDELQIDIISDPRFLNLPPLNQDPVTKYDLGTWTGAAAFVAYVLRPSNCRELLNVIIPNATKTWNQVKDEIAGSVNSGVKVSVGGVGNSLHDREQVLMQDLCRDADYAWMVYEAYVSQRSQPTAQGAEKV